MNGSICTVLLVGRPASSQVAGQQVQEGLCALRRLQAAGQPRLGLEAAKPVPGRFVLEGMEGSRTQRTRSFQRSMTCSTRASTDGDSRPTP